MSSALPLYNLKYPLDYLKFTIGIIQKKAAQKNRATFFFLNYENKTYKFNNIYLNSQYISKKYIFFFVFLT